MGSLGSSFVRDDALAYVGHLGSSQPSGVRKVLLLLLLLLSIPTRAKDIYFTLQYGIPYYLFSSSSSLLVFGGYTEMGGMDIPSGDIQWVW